MSGASSSPMSTEEMLRKIRELEAEIERLRAKLVNTWGES